MEYRTDEKGKVSQKYDLIQLIKCIFLMFHNAFSLSAVCAQVISVADDDVHEREKEELQALCNKDILFRKECNSHPY